MPVVFERDGAVGLITIDRPPVNAYDATLHAELAQAWSAAAADSDARVIILQARGDHFCAGADRVGPGEKPLNSVSSVPPWDELTMIRNLPKPTIAAVQGGCVGGGQRFVFPCDLIFCSEDAFFCDPLVSFGIGGIQAPVHAWLYGERLAKEMLFSGMRLPASRLYAMGAVNRLFPASSLAAETVAFARQIAEGDPRALRQAKRSVNTTMDMMGEHSVATRFAQAMEDTGWGGISPT